MAIDIKLPDFDVLFELANSIRDMSIVKLAVEDEIAISEAQAIKYGMENIKIGGKPASMDFLKSTIKVTGINNEILPLREKLALVTADLDKAKTYMQLFRDMISVYQTESSNKRAGLL